MLATPAAQDATTRRGSTEESDAGGVFIWGRHIYVLPMSAASNPPPLQFARPGANPTLGTIELIRAALRSSGMPMSRNSLLEQLARWGHSTSRPSLNAALAFLSDEGSVLEGSKGVMWVPVASAQLRDAVRRGKRL